MFTNLNMLESGGLPGDKKLRARYLNVEILGRSEDQIEGQKFRAKNLNMLESGGDTGRSEEQIEGQKLGGQKLECWSQV